MFAIPRTLVPVCLCLAALMPARAASVDVSFVDKERFADAGARGAEREGHLATLSAHLKSLGQRLLPPDEALSIEVLDVDLAGSVRPSRRGDVRIDRGGADWPRITLRFTLSKDGVAQQSGTENIADMDYLRRIGDYKSSESLSHEKRMLEAWFRDRFANQLAAH